MTADFKDIVPYDPARILQAIEELKTDAVFHKGVQYFYPDWSVDLIRDKLDTCRSCADFQIEFIEKIIKNSIEQTMDRFTIEGIENLYPGHCLILSNHRDIFLDAALLQNHLYDLGKPFTEISLGDNLMVNPTLRNVAKLNNMFTVFREGSTREKLRNSVHLSHYLRYAITEKKVSAWLAHRNGRTKDGNDRTSPGLIKMLLLSGGNDVRQSLEDLNIVISTISYEYEPCAFVKAEELRWENQETPTEQKGKDDIRSIISGIKSYKGNVSLVFETLNLDALSFTNNRKTDVLTIAKAIDEVIYRNYKIFKTSYMAYDLLHQENNYTEFYSPEDLSGFKQYLSEADDQDLYMRVLHMYANPLLNKLKVS